MATRADDQAPDGHAPLDAAGPQGVAAEAGSLVVVDGVVGHRPPPAGHVPTLADLDRLDGLDAHEGLGQQAVEPAVPVNVAAQPDRHAVGEDLGHSAEGVAVLGRRLHRGHHRLLGSRVEAAHRRGVDRPQVGRAGPDAVGRPLGTELDDVAQDRDPEVGEERLGQGPGRHPGCGLPGRGPLEHVAGVVEAVLLHAGQVGVARAGLGEHRGRGARGRRHLLGPLALPLGVGDLDGHRRPEGPAVADPGGQCDLIGLEAHARSAPVAEPPAGELLGDLLDGDREAGGQPLDDDHQGAPVRLSGRQEAQHGYNLPTRRCGTRGWPTRSPTARRPPPPRPRPARRAATSCGRSPAPASSPRRSPLPR